MSENAKIYHFPSEEALGDIEPLAVSATHGGVSEGATDEQADRPAPEEQAAHSALEERMPAGLPADSTHAYLWQHAAAAAAVRRRGAATRRRGARAAARAARGTAVV